ncbi:hypothetical protein GDO81_026545 [Engystomops pustulosus]|uniref:Uncharacterized protein n=1 Tax=Engystomops pustulosus TaxID=76066 RepID=A0AAV6ZTW2_ENGPU|nr:hypothetical protein GDO81_026545 [Engystomops pustulosus]
MLSSTSYEHQDDIVRCGAACFRLPQYTLHSRCLHFSYPSLPPFLHPIIDILPLGSELEHSVSCRHPRCTLSAS